MPPKPLFGRLNPRRVSLPSHRQPVRQNPRQPGLADLPLRGRHVVSYLTDMDLFARMNAVYTTYFKDPRPARTAVGVTRLAVAKARIEITVTARK